MKILPYIGFCFLLLCALCTGVNSYHRTKSIIAQDVNRALEQVLAKMPDNVVTTDTIRCYRNCLTIAELKDTAGIAMRTVRRDGRLETKLVAEANCSFATTFMLSDQKASGSLLMVGMLWLLGSLWYVRSNRPALIVQGLSYGGIVFNNDKFYELNSLDDFKTDDYTIGLFYKGKFANHLNLSSELIYNRYDIHEDRFYSAKNDVARTPYKGDKNYWRYYLSGYYNLGSKVSLWADYTQIWKDYSNSDRNENVLLYNSKETRSKLMGAISYQPFRNFNALLGSHLLTVKDENQQTAVSEKHTSWMPLFKGYWKPVKWMYLQYNYFCDVEYPNLDQLSTVRWQVNDVLWHRGNSELKPRIMHYSEITVNFVNIVKIDYMYKQSKDEIIDYYQQEEDKTYQTQANCNYRHNYLGMEGDYNLGKGVELSFVANYQWYHRYMKDDTKHFGRTWYLDTQLLWNVPNTKLSFMASYFLRHDKLPLLQGKQYDEEEKLFVGTSCSLLKGKLPISLEVSIPTSMISKKTYTKVSLPNFAYQIYGDNRVNAFVALISVKYSLGKGKTTKLNNSKNLDMEK